MSSNLRKAVKDFVAVLTEPNKNKTSAFDTQAEVVRVDGDTAWVHIPGGVDETPVQLTVNAKKGDNVQVRVGGGKAWIVGNGSSPPTDDARAIEADNKASSAVENANIAKLAAGQAEEAATQAMNSAAEAKRTTDEINAYAETAGKTVTQILNDGETAGVAAQQAKDAADNAIKGLGQVEDVVGTLNWITEHSKVTEDQTPKAGKSYYIKRLDGTFVLVTDVEGKNPAEEGWYELTEAVQNYILSHLALTDDGLYVMKDGSKWKVLIGDDGVRILDPNNNAINQMLGTGNIMGYISGMHTVTDQDSIEFYSGEDILGYIGNNKLFFASAEITSNLYVTDKYVWRQTPQGAMGLYLR